MSDMLTAPEETLWVWRPIIRMQPINVSVRNYGPESAPH